MSREKFTSTEDLAYESKELIIQGIHGELDNLKKDIEAFDKNNIKIKFRIFSKNYLKKHPSKKHQIKAIFIRRYLKKYLGYSRITAKDNKKKYDKFFRLKQQIIKTLGTPRMQDLNGRNILKPGEIPKKYSAKQILNYLAKKLRTPERVAKYIDMYMNYQYDSFNSKYGIYKKEFYFHENKESDSWMSAEYTLSHLKYGELVGDCDDFAFLARAILRRLSPPIKSEVILLPGHAICMWTKKNKFGRYDAYSIGTYGFDKNGNRKKCYETGETAINDKESINRLGFKNKIDAINSVLKKYDKTGPGVDKPIKTRFKNNNSIIKIGRTHHPKTGRSGRAIFVKKINEVENLFSN